MTNKNNVDYVLVTEIQGENRALTKDEFSPIIC